MPCTEIWGWASPLTTASTNKLLTHHFHNTHRYRLSVCKGHHFSQPCAPHQTPTFLTPRWWFVVMSNAQQHPCRSTQLIPCGEPLAPHAQHTIVQSEAPNGCTQDSPLTATPDSLTRPLVHLSQPRHLSHGWSSTKRLQIQLSTTTPPSTSVATHVFSVLSFKISAFLSDPVWALRLRQICHTSRSAQVLVVGRVRACQHRIYEQHVKGVTLSSVHLTPCRLCTQVTEESSDEQSRLLSERLKMVVHLFVDEEWSWHPPWMSVGAYVHGLPPETVSMWIRQMRTSTVAACRSLDSLHISFCDPSKCWHLGLDEKRALENSAVQQLYFEHLSVDRCCPDFMSRLPPSMIHLHFSDIVCSSVLSPFHIQHNWVVDLERYVHLQEFIVEKARGINPQHWHNFHRLRVLKVDVQWAASSDHPLVLGIDMGPVMRQSGCRWALQHLVLKGCRMKHVHFLYNLPHLLTLDISNNRRVKDGAPLSCCPMLEWLNIARTAINDARFLQAGDFRLRTVVMEGGLQAIDVCITASYYLAQIDALCPLRQILCLAPMAVANSMQAVFATLTPPYVVIVGGGSRSGQHTLLSPFNPPDLCLRDEGVVQEHGPTGF